MADLAFVVTTVAVFALVALITRGGDQAVTAGPPRMSSDSSWPSP